MAQKLTANTKYVRLLAWLRRTFPLQHPVRVRRVQIKDCGTCEFNDDTNRFHIQIDCRQCSALARDSLIHEWAHALTWFCPADDDHCAEWGVAYARIYREYLKWNYGRGPEEN